MKALMIVWMYNLNCYICRMSGFIGDSMVLVTLKLEISIIECVVESVIANQKNQKNFGS